MALAGRAVVHNALKVHHAVLMAQADQAFQGFRVRVIHPCKHFPDPALHFLHAGPAVNAQRLGVHVNDLMLGHTVHHQPAVLRIQQFPVIARLPAVFLLQRQCPFGKVALGHFAGL